MERLLARKRATPSELRRCSGVLVQLRELMEQMQLLRPSEGRLVFEAATADREDDDPSLSQDCDAFFLLFLACYCCSNETSSTKEGWSAMFAAQLERRLAFLRGVLCELAVPTRRQLPWSSTVPFLLSAADPPPSLRGARAFVAALLALLAQAKRPHERAAVLSGLSKFARPTRTHSEVIFDTLQQRLVESRAGELASLLLEKGHEIAATAAVKNCGLFFDVRGFSRNTFMKNWRKEITESQEGASKKRKIVH
jgi:hypothetical protein